MIRKDCMIYLLSFIVRTLGLPNVTNQNNVISAFLSQSHSGKGILKSPLRNLIEQLDQAYLTEKVAMKMHNLCFSSASTLSQCFHLLPDSYRLEQGLVYHGIAIWKQDIQDVMSQHYTTNVPMNRYGLENEIIVCSTVDMIKEFYDWLITLSHEIQSYTEDNIPKLENIHQTELNVALLTFWENHHQVFQYTSAIFALFEIWNTDVLEWMDYLVNLDPITDDTSTLSLEAKTNKIISTISTSVYFEFRMDISYAPYVVKLPPMLATASPAKTVRLFCLENQCPDLFLQKLHQFNYLTYPRLMRQLSYILTRSGRESTIDDMESMRDQYTYSTSLAQTCLSSEDTLDICQVCGTYQSIILFYISQAKIIEDYHGYMPYLWDIHQPHDYAVVEFNQYLKEIYRDLRIFYELPADLYLEFWESSQWSNAIEMFTLFRGYNDIWKSQSPESSLQSPFSKQNIDVRQFSLQYFWKRMIGIIEFNRNEWWHSLLKICSKLDWWSTTLMLPPTLTQQCSQASMLQCISYINTVMFDVQRLSSGKVVIPMQIQHRLAMQNQRTRSSISVINQVLTIIEKSLNSNVWKKMVGNRKRLHDHEDMYKIPTLPAVPSPGAILRCTYPTYFDQSRSVKNTNTKANDNDNNNDNNDNNNDNNNDRLHLNEFISQLNIQSESSDFIPLLLDQNEVASTNFLPLRMPTTRHRESFISTSNEILPGLFPPPPLIPEDIPSSRNLRSLRKKVSQKFFQKAK